MKNITITMVNGNSIIWKSNEYTDYECANGWFYIIDNNAYVGYYNMDYVSDITVLNSNEEGLPNFKDVSIEE